MGKKKKRQRGMTKYLRFIFSRFKKFGQSIVVQWRAKDQMLYLKTLLFIFSFLVLFVFSAHILLKLSLIVLCFLGFAYFKISKGMVLSIISLFVVMLALGHDQAAQKLNSKMSEQLYKLEHDSFEVIHRPYLYPDPTWISIQILDKFRPGIDHLEPAITFSHGLLNYGQSPALITNIDIVASKDYQSIKKSQGVKFIVDDQGPIPAFQSSNRQGNVTIHTRKVFINLNDMKRIFGFDFEAVDTDNPNEKGLIVKNIGQLKVNKSSDLINFTHFYVKVAVRYKTMYHRYEHLFDDYTTTYLIEFNHGQINVIDYSYD